MHASEVVARTEALIPVLRERAARVDELRQMPPESVADFKAAGTARLYQPVRFGGCEADMRSGVLALSAVGRGCGSSAWCLVQHLTHNFMLSQWPDQGQHDIWDADPACLVSGIFIPSCGRARSVDGIVAVRLTPQTDPVTMLRAAIAAGPVDHFEVVEPSLTDIYLHYVKPEDSAA